MAEATLAGAVRGSALEALKMEREQNGEGVSTNDLLGGAWRNRSTGFGRGIPEKAAKAWALGKMPT